MIKFQQVSKAYRGGRQALQKVELGADSYRWWFHDSATGEVLDTGEGGCSQRVGAPA